MGQNIPQWTQEVLGRQMTPQEFLANPQAQDAVFNAKFGALVQKHGPEGAARAWFAGEGGMNDMGRSDVLGTSVADYGRRFTAAYNNQQPRPPMPIPMPQQQAPQLAGAPMPLYAQSDAAKAPSAENAAYGMSKDPGMGGAPQSLWSMLQPGAAQAPNMPLFGGQMSPTDLASWWGRQAPQG